MISKQNYGDIFSVTATHATSAVATKGAVENKTYYITDLTVSSDKATSICLVKQGTSVIYQFQVGANKESISFQTPLVGDKGAIVSVEIDGTSACKANLSGFTI